MHTYAERTTALGVLSVVVFDEAALYTAAPPEVTRLAYRVVVRIVRSGCLAPRAPRQRASLHRLTPIGQSLAVR